MATSQMEKAIGAALGSLIEEHHDAVPGVDLRAILGVPATRE